MQLWPLFLNHRGRGIIKWNHYFAIYERHFSKFVQEPIVFLEIGCGVGGSLQLWKQYFGPLARVVGIDVRPSCKEYEESQIFVRIGNQADVEFLKKVIKEFGPPTVVLDDGSHRMDHITTSFEFLYPLIPPGGVYMVEDLHTAYWADYGGGLRREGTFIEYCKDFIDRMNARYARGEIEATEHSKTTFSMHVYDSVVAFDKGRPRMNYAMRAGEFPPTDEPDVAPDAGGSTAGMDPEVT